MCSNVLLKSLQLSFRVLAELPQELRYNIEGIDILIRAHLINVGRDFDPLIAQVRRFLVLIG